jgi:hypothetical protein
MSCSIGRSLRVDCYVLPARDHVGPRWTLGCLSHLAPRRVDDDGFLDSMTDEQALLGP